MDCFYLDRIEAPWAWLTAEDAGHCTRVMRYAPGQRIGAVDGKGLYVEGPIVKANKDKVAFTIEVQHQNWGEHAHEVVLVVSPLKQRDRLEWIVEKSVELGVTQLVLADCTRTERGNINLDRLERIMIAALKQCHRSRLPQLQYMPLPQVLRQYKGALAWCETTAPLAPLLPPALPLLTTLAIGPEGDFTPEEAQLAQEHGWHLVGLGQARLRTETAALYALSSLKASLGY